MSMRAQTQSLGAEVTGFSPTPRLVLNELQQGYKARCWAPHPDHLLRTNLWAAHVKICLSHVMVSPRPCCESLSEECSARNPHATFCGSRRWVTTVGDPVPLETDRRGTSLTVSPTACPLL